MPLEPPLPDELRYEAASERLHVGQGFIDHVSDAVWKYEVDGKHVVQQWFSYRRADRERYERKIDAMETKSQ